MGGRLVCVFALLLVPLVWVVLRDSPADVGTTAYGAEDEPTRHLPVTRSRPEPPRRLAIRS